MKIELSTKYFHAGSSNEFDLAVEELEALSSRDNFVNFALISAKIGITDISEIAIYVKCVK